MEKTEAGLRRPLFLRNRLKLALYLNKITTITTVRFPMPWASAVHPEFRPTVKIWT